MASQQQQSRTLLQILPTTEFKINLKESFVNFVFDSDSFLEQSTNNRFQVEFLLEFDDSMDLYDFETVQ